MSTLYPTRGRRACFAGLVLALAVVSMAGRARAEQTVGLFLKEPRSVPGYTLFTPRLSRFTYLIDHDGRLVRSWESDYAFGQVVEILDNGDLLRSCATEGPSRFNVGGAAGRIERFDWEGRLVWEFEYSNDDHRQHHGLEVLPNGNLLLIAWEYRSGDAAIAAGRDPLLLSRGELWPDTIVEVEPVGASGGNIVWVWRAWDHVIQDRFPDRPNFGQVADHPELIDLNYVPARGRNPAGADWHHANSVYYNPDLDQIVISVLRFDEIWVIDHGTTTEEAAGHTGGRYGRGGDLLYRWGNPQTYRAGGPEDQRLFRQHDARWIQPGRVGAGKFQIFNNGGFRPGGGYSSVDEFRPPVDAHGRYHLEPGAAFAPEDPGWTYADPDPSSFYAPTASGAQPLPNGNNLVWNTPIGHFFEITRGGKIVWSYVNPVNEGGPVFQGEPPDRNRVFRPVRYGPDHPGFAGRDLTPGEPLERIPP